MHLNTGTLLAYRDGELTPGRMKTVERHLAGCDGCCHEMRQLEYELELFLSLPGTGIASKAPPPDKATEEMLASVRKWRSEAGSGRCGSQLLHGVAALLAEYLGSRVAAEVVEPVKLCRRDEASLLPAADRLLSAFLGRKAASAMISELLQAVALERGLAPPSNS